MIPLPNGHSLGYITASGAMGYDGLGWPWEQPLRWLNHIDVGLFTHVMKTVTLQPRPGNFRWHSPWNCIRPLCDNGDIIGAMNAFGLTNPGFWWWAHKIGPTVDSTKIQLVGSIFGEPDELVQMAEVMNDFDLVALEVNSSCPNTQDDVLSNTQKVIKSCEAVKNKSRHPILLKLSVVQDAEKIMRYAADMIVAIEINSVPWKTIFPRRRSPLARFGGGGVSGKVAQPLTWAFAQKLKAMTEIPVVAPSVWEYDDMTTLGAKGFEAFAFGSLHLFHPTYPTTYVRAHKANLKSAEAD